MDDTMTGAGSQTSRRVFMGSLVVGAAGLAAAGSVLRGRAVPVNNQPVPPPITSDPLQRLVDLAQSDFTGDEFRRPHGFLWQKEQMLAARGGLAAPQEQVDVVVVGGGIAGLCSAYFLRDKRPVVLEQARQFGGNSRGERWNGVAYSIGAAYLSPPAPEGPILRMFEEIGIAQRMRVTQADDGGSFILDGRLRHGFWSGASDPARAGDFQRVHKVLQDIAAHRMPLIPPSPESQLTDAELKALDATSFAQWMDRELAPVHPHVHEFFEEYGWSTYGGSLSEISAAQMLSFLTADLSAMAVFPGGNSMIAQALVERLRAALPAGHLRTEALVVDVRSAGDRVHVTYEQADGSLRTLSARAVVFCAPKFIARRVVADMPAEQAEAIARLRWRSYLVANLVVNRAVPPAGYDCFRLTGRVPQDARVEARRRPFTDLIFATWALGGPSPPTSRADDEGAAAAAAHATSASSHAVDRVSERASVFTLYRGIPYDGARAELLDPTAFARIKAEFVAAIPEVASIVGIAPEDVAAVRLTRWAHPLPLAATGLITDGVLARARQPVAGRVFFAQQDNWCCPAFETSFAAASDAASQVMALL